MSSTNHQANPRYLLMVLYVFPAVIIWMYLAYGMLDLFDYNYFFVSNPVRFTLYGFILLISFVLIILTVISFIHRKTKLVVLCVTLSLLFLYAQFHFGAYSIVAGPPVCSYTTNSQHFGMYDESLHFYPEADDTILFPERIPENAKDVEYCYYFLQKSNDIAYIAVGWTVEHEKFSEVAAQLEAEKGNYFRLMDERTRPYFRSDLVVDHSTERVYYIVTTSDALLQDCSKNVIKTIAEIEKLS